MLRPRVSRHATLVPALLTAIAYVDPGNFGTNITAGARHGYALAWVVVLASVSAAVVQYLAAKLGLATGRSLAEHCADRLPRLPRLLAWAQAELVVIMTDLAEIVGGALGLQILFGVPLAVGAVAVGLTTLVVLGLGRGRYRPVALGLLGVVAVGVTATAAGLRPDAGPLGPGLRPSLAGESELLLAAGIIGATIMPHALYFHSAMSGHDGRDERPRDIPLEPADLVRRRLTRSIVTAMALAGTVNLLLLVIGTALAGSDGSIDAAHDVLLATGRDVAATSLGLALLASGFASSIVGAWTGQSVVQGFLRVRMPPWLRRGLAVVPPVALLAAGIDPDDALVGSQVVLGFALPLTLLPLVWLTGRRAVMGELRNGPVLAVAAWSITAAVTALDVALLAGAIG